MTHLVYICDVINFEMYACGTFHKRGLFLLMEDIIGHFETRRRKDKILEMSSKASNVNVALLRETGAESILKIFSTYLIQACV